MSRVAYFAYGSNMLKRRLTAADRVPSATRLAVGFLPGRRLAFDKVGQDESGKCDAEWTGRESDRVYGVVYEIEAAERPALDRAEGSGFGYNEETLEIAVDARTLRAMTYIATRKDPALRPFRWYKALTIAGALEHGLPPLYVEWLRTVKSIEDPNAERRAANEALLFRDER